MSDPLHGQTIVIVGFARQGKALARWLPSMGARAIVTDDKTLTGLRVQPDDFPGVEFSVGGHDEALLDKADALCISGGVPLDLPFVAAARERGIPLTNDAQLFLERCPAPIVGITGSAGKTTTTTLTGNIVKRARFKTWVGGNIGDVLLDDLDKIQPTDRVVMELSSFQLELMRASPDYSAVLNITPNHLDRHGTMEAYSAAKANILRHQSEDGIALLGRDDAGSRALADDVRGSLAWFSTREMVSDGAFLAGNRLVLVGLASPGGDPHVLCERGDILLRGEHNLLNVLAACALAGAAGIGPEAMRSAIQDFRGVPHRLETVRILDDVTYVNDSIATAPERVLAALKSYDEPLILLLGGRDKKLPWEDMLSLAVLKSRRIIAFGELGDLVVETVQRVYGSADPVTRVATLEEAVTAAAAAAQAGDVVLLSPGGTSYDAYADFAARGEHFRQLVRGL
jgi:UDP-N-acetylmuramoylalanine--D-glutamate ligase